jgi:hypothetical protein
MSARIRRAEEEGKGVQKHRDVYEIDLTNDDTLGRDHPVLSRDWAGEQPDMVVDLSTDSPIKVILLRDPKWDRGVVKEVGGIIVSTLLSVLLFLAGYPSFGYGLLALIVAYYCGVRLVRNR